MITCQFDAVMDLKFSALYINMNSSVIKLIISKLSIFMDILKIGNNSEEVESVTAVPRVEKLHRSISNSSLHSQDDTNNKQAKASILV